MRAPPTLALLGAWLDSAGVDPATLPVVPLEVVGVNVTGQLVYHTDRLCAGSDRWVACMRSLPLAEALSVTVELCSSCASPRALVYRYQLVSPARLPLASVIEAGRAVVKAGQLAQRFGTDADVLSPQGAERLWRSSLIAIAGAAALGTLGPPFSHAERFAAEITAQLHRHTCELLAGEWLLWARRACVGQHFASLPAPVHHGVAAVDTAELYVRWSTARPSTWVPSPVEAPLVAHWDATAAQVPAGPQVLVAIAPAPVPRGDPTAPPEAPVAKAQETLRPLFGTEPSFMSAPALSAWFLAQLATPAGWQVTTVPVRPGEAPQAALVATQLYHDGSPPAEAATAAAAVTRTPMPVRRAHSPAR